MRIDKRFKVTKVVSSDTTRQSMTNPWLENGRVVATEGHMIAIVPIEASADDVDGVIPSAALTAARGIDINCSSASAVTVGERTFIRPGLATPPWKQVVPSFDGVETVSITLSPSLLAKLAEAIGVGSSEGVTITFKPSAPCDAMLVNPSPPNGAYGVLMPMRSEANHPARKAKAAGR